MFFKKLVDKKNDKVKYKNIPKTNEEYKISVRYGCITFIDSYRFLSESLDKLVKNLDVDDFKILKEFPDKWQYLNKKLAYPYQYFNNIDDYRKPVNNLKKEDFSSKLNNKCPDDDEIERTKEIILLVDIKNVELTKLFCKGDVIFLADIFEKFGKVSTEEYRINPLYCVSLPGYTYQCALKYADIQLQTLQHKD